MLADRYRILRRMGEGGMGTVYLCEHTVLHRKLALKVLRGDLGADPELAERFRHEAIAASQIGQENVVEVLDFGRTEEGALYYVMEALEGQSLGALLRAEGPLAVPRALALLEHVCRALGAAHARGIVHRDLKPENVFVVRRDDGAERAKLIDFGISKIEGPRSGERLTRVGVIIGTPEYMAPEQAAGGAVDHRADIYALGVLAYEILTGVLPLEGETPIATLVAHQVRPPDPPSRRRAAIPADVDALVLRALAKRPEDRFDSMATLVAEIARVRARLGDTPAPTPVPAPSGSRTISGIERPRRPSAPRSDTVALPSADAAAMLANTEARRAESSAQVPAPTPTPRRRREDRGRRWPPVFAATTVLLVAAAAGAWWMAGRGGSATATTASTSTPTATPAATPRATPTATPTGTGAASARAAPAGERRAAERPGVEGRLTSSTTRIAPPRRATRLRPAAHETTADPYVGSDRGSELKPDPFQ